tara:strand:+ start:46 stop:627 length:582 start_codon:yes stop_codon:yes gene_type:complete
MKFIILSYFAMLLKKSTILLAFICILPILLNSCGMGADAKKYPPDPKLRVQKNIEEGRGFRLSTLGNTGGGNFEFASSNELWRASLDTIDFMPLASVNYSGGIIITDWYSSSLSSNENIKISIRFLSNEIRSDALDIKIFKKICDENNKCEINESVGELNKELQIKILQKAKIYETQKKDKDFKPYKSTNLDK